MGYNNVGWALLIMKILLREHMGLMCVKMVVIIIHVTSDMINHCMFIMM